MTRRFEGVGLRIFSAPEDFAETTDFYASALELECTFRNETIAIFELGGGPTLMLEPYDPEAEPDEGSLLARFTGLTLRVADIAAAYRELDAKGVRFLAPPERMPWGGSLAHFTDPAGNTHTVVEPA